MEISAVQTNASNVAFTLLTPATGTDYVSKRKFVAQEGISFSLDRPSAPQFDLKRGANLASLNRKPDDPSHLVKTFNPKGFNFWSSIAARRTSLRTAV